jgi:hypothetical protein
MTTTLATGSRDVRRGRASESRAAAVSVFRLEHRRARLIIGALIALKLVLLFVLALNSRFVMDEFGQLGYAKYLGNGLFDTVQPPKAVGFAVFYKLAHLMGWDAPSILIVGRIQTALLACATMAIVYACARALGENRVRALAVILVLLCFSNFIERIFRTIAEPLALFFAAAALLVIVRGQADKARYVIAAGVLSGLAFLATQKSVYFNVALGLAIVADAALALRYRDAAVRGSWLVLGWLIPIVGYCFLFGGTNPLAAAESLVFGPIEVATRGGAEYGGLRRYVLQTLTRNALLYLFCFTGMILELACIRRLDGRRRIALIFTVVITALVFTHDQPWPYVFIMALPFIALWSLTLFDRIPADAGYRRLAWAALGLAIALSFGRNLFYLRFDNADQLRLVQRAESLVGPRDRYFDGIGMLPNRSEPSTLWLDRHYVLRTLHEARDSEAYRIFSKDPPKVILWSYRMDAIYPVVAPLIRDSYVHIAPNLKIAGRQLTLAQPAVFDVPIAGRYSLYSKSGTAVQGTLEVNGMVFDSMVQMQGGRNTIVLRSGGAEVLLLPEGLYAGRFEDKPDNPLLFGDVYN